MSDTSNSITSALLSLEDLHVATSAGTPIVEDVSFHVAAGEILGIVGESGSGKTTSTLALMGLAHPGAVLRKGAVVADGRRLEVVDTENMAGLRGRFLSYVPQSPGTAMNPVMRVGVTLQEMMRRVPAERRLPRSQWSTQAGEVLEKVGLPRTRDFLRRYPHQLSGGQQQRVCIAVALLSGADVMILDEPTTGLDVVTQAAVLTELQRLRVELGLSMIYISHDLAVVSQIADRVAVMYRGKVIETGPVRRVLNTPRDTYTRDLLAATLDHRTRAQPATHVAPASVGRPAEPAAPGPLLSANELCIQHVAAGRVAASVQDVSFDISPGSCLALLGESGSGKSTIARTVVGLKAPHSGVLSLAGEPLPALAHQRTKSQRRHIQMVFQNSSAALNPRESVGVAIERGRAFLGARASRDEDGETQRAGQDSVEQLLDMVRLPASMQHRFPRELSGGERQRVCIARALSSKPDLIICDEITSALDVSVQASVLKLLKGLQAELGLALLFITHDMGVVSFIADDVVVLEHGVVRETGSAAQVLHDPTSKYMKKFMEAVPVLDRRGVPTG